MSAILGIYENGVVRLLGPVDLPEGSQVEVVAKRGDSSAPSVPNLDQDDALDAIYEILSERDSGGDPLVSARHDEIEDKSWIAGVNQAWAEDWNDPREDIYTVNDGEPLDGPR